MSDSEVYPAAWLEVVSRPPNARRAQPLMASVYAVDGDPTKLLVQQGPSGGGVNYTVLILVGDKEVPQGSKLSVTTNISVAMTGGVCDAGSAGNIILGGSTPKLPTKLVITCHFYVTVTPDHKMAGQIDPILVTAVFTNTSNDDAFYIPPVTSPAVPVYTGGSITVPTSDASTDSTPYYTGESAKFLQVSSYKQAHNAWP